MLKLLLLTCIALFIFKNSAPAQNNTASGKVNVSVTDMKSKPRKGDIIVFQGKTSQKIFTKTTDASGKFFIQLPAGDKYIVSIKNFDDTTHYGEINIPALEAGQFYDEPFKINIEYEPARTFTLDNVQFDIDKATLRSESYPALQELVDYMQLKENIRIEIAGHTDNAGNDTDNLKLSEQRANAIRSYLIKKGISPGRILAKGYGATQPIGDNNTSEGRQMNRRTEVRIL